MKKYITAANAIRFMGLMFGVVAATGFVGTCLTLFLDVHTAAILLVLSMGLWVGAVKCFFLGSDIEWAEAQHDAWEAQNNV
tara:strand:+ start:206 stop:448 length:243 start_codon:yes stop_codon:yes gene_type:complete